MSNAVGPQTNPLDVLSSARLQAVQLTQLRNDLSRIIPQSPLIAQLNQMVKKGDEHACQCAALVKDFPGPLTPEEVAGYRRLARTFLVFRTFLADGKISSAIDAMGNPLGNNSQMRLCDMGKTADGDTFGLLAGQKLKRYHTPLEHDGTLGKNKAADVYGIKVAIRAENRSSVDEEDLRAIEEASVIWVEGGVPTPVGYLGDLLEPVSDGREDHQYGGGLYFNRVLSSYRGGENRDSYIILDFPDPSLSLTKRYKLAWTLDGPAYQRSIPQAV